MILPKPSQEGLKTLANELRRMAGNARLAAGPVPVFPVEYEALGNYWAFDTARAWLETADGPINGYENDKGRLKPKTSTKKDPWEPWVARMERLKEEAEQKSQLCNRKREYKAARAWHFASRGYKKVLDMARSTE